jgi:hypothetical protein
MLHNFELASGSEACADDPLWMSLMALVLTSSQDWRLSNFYSCHASRSSAESGYQAQRRSSTNFLIKIKYFRYIVSSSFFIHFDHQVISKVLLKTSVISKLLFPTVLLTSKVLQRKLQLSSFVCSVLSWMKLLIDTQASCS